MSLSLDVVEMLLVMIPTAKCPEDDLHVSMKNNP
jgi:hypothetical protein